MGIIKNSMEASPKLLTLIVTAPLLEKYADKNVIYNTTLFAIKLPIPNAMIKAFFLEILYSPILFLKFLFYKACLTVVIKNSQRKKKRRGGFILFPIFWWFFPF